MPELWSVGWPKPAVQGREPQTLHHLIRNLRNAVAHFNVELQAEPAGEITSVTVWTKATGREGEGVIKGSRLWECRFTVEDLEALARRIADVYLKKFGAKAA
jgi:hypothetical protein